MDHRLIDQALNMLLSTKATDRTPEQIQGFARLICAAADVKVDSPTPTLASLPKLHAALSMLATQLDVESLSPNSSVTTQVSMSGKEAPSLRAYIHNTHGFGDGQTVILLSGNCAEEVLRSFRNKAYDLCQQVPA